MVVTNDYCYIFRLFIEFSIVLDIIPFVYNWFIIIYIIDYFIDDLGDA